jgi:hypothetical protein
MLVRDKKVIVCSAASLSETRTRCAIVSLFGCYFIYNKDYETKRRDRNGTLAVKSGAVIKKKAHDRM